MAEWHAMCCTIQKKQYAFVDNYGSLQCSPHPFELILFIWLTQTNNFYCQPGMEKRTKPHHSVCILCTAIVGRIAENGHQTRGYLCLMMNCGFTQACKAMSFCIFSPKTSLFKQGIDAKCTVKSVCSIQ